MNNDKTLRSNKIRGIFLPTMGGEHITSDPKGKGARHVSNRPSHSADGIKEYMNLQRMIRSGLVMILMLSASSVYADTFKITAYCSCMKCCGKSDGITASGHKVQYGYCAGNWLPFHTKVKIEGLGEFKVMDRGAKSLFGSKTNHIKHLDIWLPSHREALRFGVQYKEVSILK